MVLPAWSTRTVPTPLSWRAVMTALPAAAVPWPPPPFAGLAVPPGLPQAASSPAAATAARLEPADQRRRERSFRGAGLRRPGAWAGGWLLPVMMVDLHVRVVMSCPVADTRGITGVFMCRPGFSAPGLLPARGRGDGHQRPCRRRHLETGDIGGPPAGAG